MDKALKEKLFNGEIPKGCKYCIKGEKLVLFVTGLCSRNCFYCPISEVKKNKDIAWANERKINYLNDLIEEAKSMKAEGCGITGGDPLLKIEKTCRYIRALKNKFGKKFHIHLYNSLGNQFNEINLRKLENSGLDELRVHPDLFNNKYWDRIILARKFKFKIGVEIPVIPKKENETINIVEFFKDKVDFFNLNELESSELNINYYIRNNLMLKDNLSYAIKGSEELSKKIVKNYPGLNIHYCSSSFKDKIQFGRRILRTAKNTRNKFDIVTKDGMLKRGAIYADNLKSLNSFMNKLRLNNLYIDKKNSRILTSIKTINKLKGVLKKQGFKPAIVEEYPTYDGLQVSMEFI